MSYITNFDVIYVKYNGSWCDRIESVKDNHFWVKWYPMEARIYRWEKIKKYNHVKNCHDWRKYFPLFVISVNGMLGREALVVLANLSRLMATKIDEPILYVQSWVNRRIVIAVTRLYSRMICWDKLPSPLRDQELDWDPASGLRLAH